MEKCKVIAVTNPKGGVGKITTTVNLGVGLAQQGKKVLRSYLAQSSEIAHIGVPDDSVHPFVAELILW